MTVLDHRKAVEHAKTLAPQYRLGTRQQDALAAMLEMGRWPVALPESRHGQWIWGTGWSATVKMMATLERKGVLAMTGKTHKAMGYDEVPVYVLSDAMVATLPSVEGQPEAPTAPPPVRPEAAEPPAAPQRGAADPGGVVVEALTSAATGYAYALDAVYTDITATFDDLAGGKLRQLSNNGAELLVRFGALVDIVEVARKLLPRNEIRDILQGAAAVAGKIAQDRRPGL